MFICEHYDRNKYSLLNGWHTPMFWSKIIQFIPAMPFRGPMGDIRSVIVCIIMIINVMEAQKQDLYKQ